MPQIIPEESMRFDWPNDPTGGWIEINHLTDPVIQAIVVSNTETATTLDSDTKTMEVSERRDAEKIRDKIAIKAIKSWGNFYDLEGDDLPCTPVNICKFTEQDGFIVTLNKLRKKLQKHLAKKKEAATKNSLALPSGSPE